MSGFDYGNARLRAMKSRLLSRQTLVELAGSGSVQGLLNALTKTAYREAVETALVQYAGWEGLAAALENDLVNTVGKARNFYAGKAAELATLVFRRYDVYNIKTILRGLRQRVPANEILNNTLPIGELQPADLATLVRLESARGAIDLLATWREPLAQPLLRVRSAPDEADLFQMELALERWYFDTSMAVAAEESEALQQTLMLDADVNNVLIALRLIGVEGAATFLRQRFDAEDAGPLFVGPGRISPPLLIEAVDQETVPQAVVVLEETPYAQVLAEALRQYRVTGRLSEFERAFTREKLRQGRGLFIRDPHGIGVLIGYIALKTAEIANLRWIGQGLWLGEDPDTIRAELLTG